MQKQAAHKRVRPHCPNCDWYLVMNEEGEVVASVRPLIDGLTQMLDQQDIILTNKRGETG